MTQPRQTNLTLFTMGQRVRPHLSFHHPATRQLTNYLLKLLTIHAKHLADFTLPQSASATLSAGRSLASNNARARCSRERTVPIAQPRISAVSTYLTSCSSHST